MIKIYLASQSPRRRELLELLHIPFDILSVEVIEERHPDELLENYVERLAREKAQAGVKCAPEDLPVLGADTIVVFEEQLFEKPRSAEEARRMLNLLSGKKHQVMTAIAFANSTRLVSKLVKTEVEFGTLTTQIIDDYIASDEYQDKAGAYGIQGIAGGFVRKIVGSYHAVVGLPLLETRELLMQLLTDQENLHIQDRVKR